MLTIANLVARGAHVIVSDCVTYGLVDPDYRGRRYRLEGGNGADWYSATSRLVIWSQEFPGANLDVLSDLTAPLMAHTR